MASRKLRNAPAEMGAPDKLKTQLNITRRMIKEVQAYEKEVVTNEGRYMKYDCIHAYSLIQENVLCK